MTMKKGRFSTTTAKVMLSKIGCMNFRTLSNTLIVAAAVQVGGAYAANAPLDFSYRVTGAHEIKPLMVFNDGATTFIQPQDVEDKALRVNGSAPVKQGPYYVVQGVPSEITISKDKKTTIVIAHVGQAVKAASAKLDAPDSGAGQALPASVREKLDAGASSKTGEQPDTAAAARKTTTCKPSTSGRDSALVVAFKANAAVLSDTAKGQIAEILKNPLQISQAEVIAEADAKALRNKRGDAITQVLVDAGVTRDKVQIVPRELTGIGSEIHIHRTIEIPCNAEIVNATTRKAPLTVLWDGDAKKLLERIATSLSMRVSVDGDERPIPVRIAGTDDSFSDVMTQIGRAIDADADLILRGDELVMKFKGRSAK